MLQWFELRPVWGANFFTLLFQLHAHSKYPRQFHDL